MSEQCGTCGEDALDAVRSNVWECHACGARVDGRQADDYGQDDDGGLASLLLEV